MSNSSSLYDIRHGFIPLMVSVPHNGTVIPDDIRETMTEAGQSSRDTDWFLDRLYDFFEAENASQITARISRYVVDLNRSTDSVNLYPGQDTPELCPTACFDRSSIYESGREPDEAEIQRRVEEYWRPYHDALQTELERLVDHFGFVVLFDAHSIASEVPRLFDGRLPDFNFGTNNGKSCTAEFQEHIETFAESINGYSHVVNGRFVGGHITRYYGRPEKRVNAVQLELSQATYMNELDHTWKSETSEQVQGVLRSFFQSLISWTSQNQTASKNS
ncbi:N-formylglutamate deformylase [Vicingaceae bacterium]|nr:N-formylglutamate deformylase [Vicingaceae bacterium]